MTTTLSHRILAALLAAPLCIAACATDDGEEAVSTEQQGLNTCTLQRPYTWTDGRNQCHEASSINRPLRMVDGATYQATAVNDGSTTGEGDAIVGCSRGAIVKSGSLNGTPLGAVCAPI